MEECFICHQGVLEFAGQFANFDTYLLSSADTEALDAKAFGYCHAKCLDLSPWGAYWRDKRKIHFSHILSLGPIWQNDLFALYFHPRSKEFYFLTNTGLIHSFKNDSISKVLILSNDILIPSIREYNQELPDLSAALKVRTELLERGRYSLLEFAKLLGLEHTLTDHEVVDLGYLSFKKSLKRDWRGNWISAEILSYQRIPKEAFEVALEAVGRE